MTFPRFFVFGDDRIGPQRGVPSSDDIPRLWERSVNTESGQGGDARPVIRDNRTLPISSVRLAESITKIASALTRRRFARTKIQKYFSSVKFLIVTRRN
jgi:hypothetical protein